MKKYFLKTSNEENLEKIHKDQNLRKAVNELSGICKGIMADQQINQQEVDYFYNWLNQYTHFFTEFPFSHFVPRLNKIFEDGIIDNEEAKELKEIFNDLAGQSDIYSIPNKPDKTNVLPFTEPRPSEIEFDDNEFVLTGTFVMGKRAVVENKIIKKGGYINSRISHDTCYLVIGQLVSKNWITTSYGRKIEKAIELNEKYSDVQIEIISERTLASDLK